MQMWEALEKNIIIFATTIDDASMMILLIMRHLVGGRACCRGHMLVRKNEAFRHRYSSDVGAEIDEWERKSRWLLFGPDADASTLERNWLRLQRHL